MSDWGYSATELQAFFEEWLEIYEPTYVSLEDVDVPKLEELKKLDEQKLIWTLHGTCEDEMVSPKLHMFGDCSVVEQTASGCGCWQTVGFYITKTPWEDENERYQVGAYLPCEKCNPEGEDEETDPECKECEGQGFINHYFD